MDELHRIAAGVLFGILAGKGFSVWARALPFWLVAVLLIAIMVFVGTSGVINNG